MDALRKMFGQMGAVAGEQVVHSFESLQNPKNQRMAVFDWPRRCHSSVELFMLIFVC